MESDDAMRQREAKEAIEGVAQARQRLAQHMTTPWWYSLGTALSILAIFLGLGLLEGLPGLGSQGTAGNTMIILGAVIGPVALVSALKNATGISIDRYANGLGWWYASVFVLLAIGFGLHAFAGLSLALPVTGALAFTATLLRERHIDTLLRRRVATRAPEGLTGD